MNFKTNGGEGVLLFFVEAIQLSVRLIQVENSTIYVEYVLFINWRDCGKIYVKIESD